MKCVKIMPGMRRRVDVAKRRRWGGGLPPRATHTEAGWRRRRGLSAALARKEVVRVCVFVPARKEVWAIAIAQYAAGWGFYGLLAWLPVFFLEHCGLQLSQLGGFTLAPYLLQAAGVGACAGLMADNLISRRGRGVRDVRVLMQVAGMLGPAAHNVVGALLWARWVGDKPLPEDGGGGGH